MHHKGIIYELITLCMLFLLYYVPIWHQGVSINSLLLKYDYLTKEYNFTIFNEGFIYLGIHLGVCAIITIGFIKEVIL